MNTEKEIGLEPRRVAWKALLEWKSKKGFIAERVSVLGASLEPKERAFALEIALGVCRNLSLLEYNAKTFADRKPEKEEQHLLLVALYQIWFAKEAAPHAIVNTTVAIAKQEFGKKKAGFFNAVLRKAVDAPLTWPNGKSLKSVAVRYSHPGWMVQKWVEELGFSKMILRLRRNQEQPMHWLRVNLTKASLEEVADQFSLPLEEQRFERFLPYTGKMRELLQSKAFLEGKISLQDPTAGFLLDLLALSDEDSVLDLCSAPGGKTALIREANSSVQVVSCDVAPKRLYRLEDHRKRLQLPVVAVAQNGMQPAFIPESFSHVLVDAPCSNLGVITRRPETKWHCTTKSMLETADLQYQILEGAAPLVKQGGVLLYSTCSPEPEETSAVVERFLKAYPEFELESARKYIHRRYVKDGFFRIVPAPGSLDGFFGARLIKKNSE